MRHTAATWLMHTGTPTGLAAGFLGMSEQTLREVYGHHHPDFMQDAVANITKKPTQRVGAKPSATILDLKKNTPGFPRKLPKRTSIKRHRLDEKPYF